jgi:hypothetical protein
MFTLGTMAKATLGVLRKINCSQCETFAGVHICIIGSSNTIVFYIPQFGNSGPHVLYRHVTILIEYQ